MSPRQVTADVSGVGVLRFALHHSNDRYISEEIDALGTWEPLETELIRRFLRPGDLFVDGGANLGWYTVIAAKLGAEVVAFEPMDANLALLTQNVALNDVGARVTVRTVALGRAPGHSALQLSTDNQGDHRVSAQPTGATQTVEVASLDDELRGRVPRILKVDTQGSEVAVLRGGRRCLDPARTRGTLMILEYWAFGLADCGASAEELVGHIAAYVPKTHDCFEIVERTGRLRRITLFELATMVRDGDYSPSAGGHTNIVLVPIDEVPTISDMVDLADEGAQRSFEIAAAERSFTSQFGEDGVLADLAIRVGAPHTMIEFGAGDGSECNSRYLRSCGWQVAAFDGDPGDSDWVEAAWITASNAPALVERCGFGREFGILSIDLDGNDYWVLRSILKQARPRVVVCEYNATLGPVAALTVPYRAHRRWDHTNYFGASLAAFAHLGAAYGYALVGCGSEGVNAYLVRRDLLNAARIDQVAVSAAYRPPRYGIVDALGSHVGHLPTTRRFVEVPDEAAAEAAMRVATAPGLIRPARVLAHALRTHDLVRYRRALATGLRNRLRGVPTK